MEPFLIHILKSSGLLCIFFLAYYFLLRKDTNFNQNRFFLLAGIFAAAMLPFVEFQQTVLVELTAGAENDIAATKITASGPAQKTFDLWYWISISYLLVTSILLCRLFYQILRILKMALPHLLSKNGNFVYIKTRIKTSPCSFFNIIIYNPSNHTEEELQMILEHERVHARQFHTLDILLINFFAAVLWFNPLSWFYKKSVEENLEYIADQETIKILGRSKDYQYALLRVSQENALSGLLNHFHHSFIKTRIIMLDKTPTSRNQQWKRLLVLPVLFTFLLACNTKEKIVFSHPADTSQSTAVADQEPIFYIDSQTSNTYLRGMEAYFRKNHPELQIAFTGVTRRADDKLTGFQVETLFEGEEKFSKRMENLSEEALKPRFAMQYSPEAQGLIIKEQFEKEVTITITKDAIYASHIEKSGE